MPVPFLGRVIRHRHSAVDEERGGRVVARHIDNKNNFQRQFFLFWHCTQLQIGTCTTHHYTAALHTNVYKTFSCQDKQIYLRYKLQVNFLSTLTLWTIK